MITTLIIGKNSNLSNQLSKELDNCVLISSREILQNINQLDNYKDSYINIIFNNFQPATELYNLSIPTNYINNAITVTSLVLEYFQNSKINKIIYTSSSSVYGNNILCKESDELKPMSLQGALKVSNEKLVEKFCDEHGIDYTIARVFNMYGGEDNFSVISKIINAGINQEEITIINNGNAMRDFIHIDDVVEIYKILLNKTGIPIINVGTGTGLSVKIIIDYLKNKGIQFIIANKQKDELKISTADTQLLTKITGKVDFKNIEHYLEEKLIV